MSKLTQVAAILAKKGFVAGRHMLMACAFRSTVKRNDDHVGFSAGLANRTQRVIQVQEVVSARIGGEGNNIDLAALGREMGNITNLAGVRDSLLLKHAPRTFTAFWSEIHGVIVGQAHHVKAGRLQVCRVAGRHAKSKAMSLGLPTALGGCAVTVEHGALEI